VPQEDDNCPTVKLYATEERLCHLNGE